MVLAVTELFKHFATQCNLKVGKISWACIRLDPNIQGSQFSQELQGITRNKFSFFWVTYQFNNQENYSATSICSHLCCCSHLASEQKLKPKKLTLTSICIDHSSPGLLGKSWRWDKEGKKWEIIAVFFISDSHSFVHKRGEGGVARGRGRGLKWRSVKPDPEW